MKINIELTPELLQVLSPEATKKILLDLITSKENLTGISPTANYQPISENHLGNSQPKLSCWNKKIPDEAVEEIMKRHSQGEKLRVLAIEYGYNYSSVTTAVQRLKKKSRPSQLKL